MEPDIKQSGCPFRWGKTPVSIVLIVLAGVIVYFNSLGGDFIWDDIHFVKNNVYLRNWSHLGEIFSGDVAAGSGMRYNYYRPLTIFTYLIDHTIWGLAVGGYHLSSILLHILVALSVYSLLHLLFHDHLLSFFAGLLYVVHPIHTETVAYISGRPDSLAALCILICFLLYIKQLHRGTPFLFLLMVFSYIGALFSRENSVVLPGLLLLYHFAFKEKFKLNQFLPLAGIALAYIGLRFMLLDPMVVPSTFIQRLPGFLVALAAYFRLLLFPLHLHQEYGMKLFGFFQPGVAAAAGMVMTVLLLGLVVVLKKGQGRELLTMSGKGVSCGNSPGLARGKGYRLLFFPLAWFLIGLVPVSGIYPIKAYMAEHWLYLPSIGLFFLLGYGLSFLYRRAGGERLVIICLLGLVTFYGALTIKQNRYFKDPVTFYERTLRYNPESARLRNNLGIKYFEMGRIEEGMGQFRKATELDPNYPDAYNNLGHAYYSRGEMEEALTLFKKALAINPGYAAAYNNLGVLYTRLGEEKRGIICFEKAAEINPYDADTLFNLGLAYRRVGEGEHAVACFDRLLEIDPSYGRAHHQLARLYFAGQNYRKAHHHLREALRFGCPVEPELMGLLDHPEQ